MRYFKKMIIPTDGCNPAKAGVLQGLRIAKFLGTETQVVIPIDDAIFFKDACEVESFEAAESIVEEIEEAANSIYLGLKVISKEGDAKDVIDKLISDDENINLICMGIKSHKDATDVLMGSLHEHLLKTARIPVILQTFIGKRYFKKFNSFKERIGELGAHKVTILILMDGSPQGDHAAHEAIQFANQLNVATRVVALHVVGSLKDADGKEKIDPAEYMAIPEKAKNMGLDIGIVVKPEVRVAEDKPKELVRRAAELKADMIVMGTHGKTGPLRRFIGNKTEFVLKTVPVPVMVVPPELRRSMNDIKAEEYVDDVWDEIGE